MSKTIDSDQMAAARTEDVPRILKAMTHAVREALMRHKQAANPVAVWRNGQVEWVKPEDIPENTRLSDLDSGADDGHYQS